jgi:hypothetical protein
MTTRRLREWPRLILAVALLAVVLVLIGVVVASASSNASSHPAASPQVVSALRSTGAAQAARLHSDDQALARAQLALGRDSARLAVIRRELRINRASARCWQAKATDPKRERAVRCAAVR